MKCVRMYRISTASPVLVQIPSGGRIVHVGMVGWEPALWVECDPEAPLVRHLFEVYGDDDSFVEPAIMLEHVGSFYADSRVFHVYQRIPA